MPTTRKTKSKRSDESACESRLHPDRFCPRCSLRLTAKNPLIEHRNHCALCEREIRARRITVGLFH